MTSVPAKHEYEQQKFANRQLFIQYHPMSGILNQTNALKKLNTKRRKLTARMLLRLVLIIPLVEILN